MLAARWRRRATPPHPRRHRIKLALQYSKLHIARVVQLTHPGGQKGCEQGALEWCQSLGSPYGAWVA